MKTVITRDLKNRIKACAHNGSPLARAILEELKKPIEEVTDKKANYFNSRRKISSSGEHYGIIDIEITYCNKDLTNERFADHDNPRAPYFEENRTSTSIAKFVGMFKNIPAPTSEDIEAFDSMMRLGKRVRYVVSGDMEDIRKAYDGREYSALAQDGQSTLHHSCMRHPDVSRNAADFYANFAGCKILRAETEDGEVVGLCLLWNNVEFEMVGGATFNFVERVYTAYKFLYHDMLRRAIRSGYCIRKKYNDYNHMTQFVVMADCESTDGRHIRALAGAEMNTTVRRAVPAIQWHKKGAPYLDTMPYLCYNDGMLYLTNNTSEANLIAALRSTDGHVFLESRICPICGKVHNDGGVYCHECKATYMADNDYMSGMVKGGVKIWNGAYYPAMLIDGEGEDARPTALFGLTMNLFKLSKK